IIRPALNESIGYNSNVTGLSPAPSSWFLETAPSVAIDSQWSQSRVGALLSADNFNYFSASNQNLTNAVGSIGGAYTSGRSSVSLAYSILLQHELPTDIGAPITTTPVPYVVNDIRSDYTYDFGRLSLTPNIEFQTYRFGNGSLPTNLTFQNSQSFQNRNVVQGGVTAAYKITDQQNGVLVLRGINQNFPSTPTGQLSPDSNSAMVLVGVESKYTGTWLYRVLVGAETRQFKAYPSHTAPIIEANAVWTPRGRTTVTGVIRREIEDPTEPDTNGFTLTGASLVLDQEIYHNILAQGRLQYQYLKPLQGGGNESNFTVGAGVSWLVNRNVRLALNYDYTDQKGSSGQIGTVNRFVGTPYTRNLVMLTMRLAL
ncbi:MAG: outer membrane beta-barrel protein, partial [Acetobacteraceae bacterium]|nr:outer membrane beta-barrel protein [Acetobacteraceae bacterium]